MSAVHASAASMTSPMTTSNLSALGKALDQTTISSPSTEDMGSPTSLSMSSAGGATPAARKSPKKRERTDSMKKMIQAPAAQRQRQDSLAGDDSDAQNDDDGSGDEFSDGSNAEPVIKLPVKDRTGSAVAGVPRGHLISNAVKTAPPAKEKSNPRRWSKHEDESLRLAVERSGERNWKAIAEQVPGRNHTQCLQRWTKVLKPGLIKGHWDPEEDAKLRDLVAEGKRNWGQVASLIPGRTSKQCRERWCNHLDPNINKGLYTEEEDRIIMEMQAKLGNRWSIIAQQLKGRTEDAVKIRWKSLMRGKKAAGKDQGQPSPSKAEANNPTSDSSLSSACASKPEEKQPRAKPARTPTKQKTRAASPVTKVAEMPNQQVKPVANSRVSAQPGPLTVPPPIHVPVNERVMTQSMDQKDVAASINSYMQNVNDLVAASIHNFKLSNNYPASVQVATAPTASQQSSNGMIGVGHPSLASQTSISPANQPVYSLQPNAFPTLNQPQRSYAIQTPYHIHQNLNLPPNYVVPTSGLQGAQSQQYAMSVHASGVPISMPMGTYGGYGQGIVNVASSGGRPVSLASAPGYPTPSVTTAPPGVSYSSGTSVLPPQYGVASNISSSGNPHHLGASTEHLAPVSASIPPHVQSTGVKLNTPREEWGSSQTPRSHLIMTEGHASAYELFHQQRLRLMLKEREKGMSLTSAPSPGQAMLTKELKANKERQKRQEMMQKGWKSAVDAMMSLNNDASLLEENDGLMEKVGLSALDPTDEELMDTTVEISLPPDDTIVEVDDAVMLDHE